MSGIDLESKSFAYHEGIAGRNDGRKPYDNPYNAFSQHQQFADWRDGWHYRDDEIADESDHDDDCAIGCRHPSAHSAYADLQHRVLKARQELSAAIGMPSSPLETLETIVAQVVRHIAQQSANPQTNTSDQAQ